MWMLKRVSNFESAINLKWMSDYLLQRVHIDVRLYIIWKVYNLTQPLPIIILYLLPSSLILAQVTSKAQEMLDVSKVPSSSMNSLFDSWILSKVTKVNLRSLWAKSKGQLLWYQLLLRSFWSHWWSVQSDWLSTAVWINQGSN